MVLHATMRQENSQTANRRIAVAAIRLICKQYAIDPKKRRHGCQAEWDRCVGVGVVARIIISVFSEPFVESFGSRPVMKR